MHRDVIGGAAEDALTEDHERERDVEQVGVRLPDVHRAEDDPVGEAQPPSGDHVQFVLPHLIGLIDHDPEAPLLGGDDDRIGQFGEVRLANGWDRETDDSGLARAKTARREIRLIAQFLDGHQNPIASRRPHVGIVVDDVGHRLDGDACDASNVVHRGIHRAPSWSPRP